MSATTTITRTVDRAIEAAERVNGYMSRHGARRGLELALRARPGRTEIREMTWQGYKAPFRLRMNGGSDLATFHEVIVDEDYHLPFDYTPSTIIDAGANIGFTSIYFANLFPDATIVALEPDPANFALLVENTAPYPNIHAIECALWTSSGRVRLGDPNLGPRGYRVDEATERGFEVDALDLPTIMDRFDMERIDLLKVDIEGAEVELFADTDAWLGRVDVLAVELHDRFRPGCSRTFFGAIADFPDEWVQGETTIVRRAEVGSSN